ncbi:amidophosphoribosyltransferase [Alicyclobacillus macrosporangiidus]|uniref:Amidophosphoribosyltransferase n=1 Tax=Alicyclobacillus macrosporangiidus TaxID=392015 RepID=A0A1I7LAG8_9BACL|nr:amidophosphoribosyltransferase [Alicyclobacillus macrosporangiidus]SFV06526.1 amidophosphoribosyltransferase [Alicyclobacillus macrosporangiidus]
MPFREDDDRPGGPGAARALGGALAGEDVEGDDRPREECGVFGVFGHPRAAQVTYYGLLALQHRGQEAAGITATDGERMYSHKGLGLLSDVFRDGQLDTLQGSAAIGHVRYSTAGSNTVQNAQPITVLTHRGNLAMAHNGNLVNAGDLRRWLEKQGSLFQSTSDTEVVLHLVARAGRDTVVENIQNALSFIKGGYALVFLTEHQLVAVRDPLGLRPLCLGRLGDGYVVASESCAFETIGAEFLRDVEPGELIAVGPDGLQTFPPTHPTRRAMCTFEHIYFARPDSDIDGWNVHAVRKQLGRILAQHHPAEGDIVIGVPDSSISAASGFAEESGIPFEMGLVKNKYIARTFIQPAQELRDIGVRLKLNAVRSVVDGKRVVLIDDSIVRGTTSRRIVQLLREAGAREVHVRISSPPYRYTCHYGIDTSSKGQLIAARMSVEEICREIDADSLEYLTQTELMQAFGFREGERVPFCNACFSGQYPTEVYEEDKRAHERAGAR